MTAVTVASRSTVSRMLRRRSLTRTCTSRSPTRITCGLAVMAVKHASASRAGHDVASGRWMRLRFALMTSKRASASVVACSGGQMPASIRAPVISRMKSVPVDRLPPEVDPGGRRSTARRVQAAREVGDPLALLLGDDAVGGGILQDHAVQRFLDAVQVRVTTRLVRLWVLISSSSSPRNERLLFPVSRVLGQDLFQPLAEAAVAYRVLVQVHVDVVADRVLHLRRARPRAGHRRDLLPEVGRGERDRRQHLVDAEGLQVLVDQLADLLPVQARVERAVVDPVPAAGAQSRSRRTASRRRR